MNMLIKNEVFPIKPQVLLLEKHIVKIAGYMLTK